MPYPSNFPLVYHLHNFTETLSYKHTAQDIQYLIVGIWILGLITFYLFAVIDIQEPEPEPEKESESEPEKESEKGPEPEPEPEPELKQEVDEENDWKPIGIYRDYSTYTTHLLYQHKTSRIRRFRNRKGYVYPDKKDLALYGTRLT